MNLKHTERELLRKNLASNEKELEQLQHQQQRLENRIAYYEKADRKKRTHRLCTIAGTMESIAPELRELTTPEVIELLEQIFDLPNVGSVPLAQNVQSHELVACYFFFLLNKVCQIFLCCRHILHACSL